MTMPPASTHGFFILGDAVEIVVRDPSRALVRVPDLVLVGVRAVLVDLAGADLLATRILVLTSPTFSLVV